MGGWVVGWVESDSTVAPGLRGQPAGQRLRQSRGVSAAPIVAGLYTGGGRLAPLQPSNAPRELAVGLDEERRDGAAARASKLALDGLLDEHVLRVHRASEWWEEKVV